MHHTTWKTGLSAGLLTLGLTGCIDAQLTFESSSASSTSDTSSTASPSPGAVAISSPADGQTFNGTYSFAGFTISGTCSQEGATVTLSSTVTALNGLTTNCASGLWSISQSLAGWPDGTDSVTVALGSDTHSISITKDTSVGMPSVVSGPASATVNLAGQAAAAYTLSCPEAGAISYTASVWAPGSGSDVTGTVTCSAAGSHAVSLDLTGMTGDGATLVLSVGFTDVAGNVASPASWVGTLDVVAPAAPTFTTMVNEDYYPGSGLNRYTLSTSVTVRGSAAAGTTVGLYGDGACSGLIYSDASSNFPTGFPIGISANATLTIFGRATDAAGNPSTCVALLNAINDSAGPDVSALAVNDGSVTGSVTSTPNVTWGSATDTAAGVANYQLALGTTPGAIDVLGWVPLGLVNSYTQTGLALTNGNTYYASVRSFDNVGNVSTVASGNGFVVTLPPSTPSLSVLPEDYDRLTLSWTNVAGETHYEIEKDTSPAFGSPTPFTSGADTTATTSSGLTFRTYYYYRIRAVNAGGASAWSATASARPLLNLQIPIEMVDVPLEANTSVATVFNRTRTTITPSAYDGNPQFFFEVVAQNNDSSARNVDLVDSAGTPGLIGTISIPPFTSQDTRFRVPVSISAMDQYRIRLPAVSGGGTLLKVSAARVIVRQTGANRTRLFIPLSGPRALANNFDDTVGVSVDQQTGITYTGGLGAMAGTMLFKKRPPTYFPNLDGANPWVYEAVFAACGGGTAYTALTTAGGGSIISGTELSTSSPVPTLMNASFPDGAALFTAGSDFEAKIRSGGGTTACLFRAYLWVALNDLTTVWVPHRGGRSQQQTGSGDAVQDGGRQIYEGPLFSLPLAHFEVTGDASGGGSTMSLLTCGSNDTGPASCASPVAGSMLSLIATPSVLISGDLSITSSDRWSPRFTTTAGTGNARASRLWIRSSGTP